MSESKERSLNLRWVLIILFLLIGINGLLTRLLEGLWDSLRQRNSPVYLPLAWWMSTPFTLFVFAVLAALITSFSGLKTWFRTFLLLCAFKIIFSAVTAVFLYYRMDIGVVGAATHAMFLSLPSVLVHLLLSGLAVMFLRDREAFADKVTQGALSTPYLVQTEIEQPLLQPEATPEPTPVAAPRRAEPSGTLSIPTGRLLQLFPEGELVMTPREVEELSPSIQIDLDVVLPQLPEGRIEVDAMEVISRMPEEAFRHLPGEVAGQFQDGRMELPLQDVIPRLPLETFEFPPQELQPDVDGEFPDIFREERPVAVADVAEATSPAAEQPVAAPVEEKEPETEEVSATAVTPEEALSLTEEERTLLESSRDVIRLSTHSVLSQFPKDAIQGTVRAESHTPAAGDEEDESARLPESVVIPVELIVPQLPEGQVRLPAKFILSQLPQESLSVPYAEIIRSLPRGEVELPLREIVSELPPDVLVLPDQEAQPDVAEFPDPFREIQPVQPAAAEGPLPSRGEELAALAAADTAEAVEPSPGEPRVEKGAPVSYAEMLLEENPLTLPVDSVVGLFPAGALRLSPDELKQRLGSETLKLPRSLTMGQLREGRVVVPVEVLTTQLPPECLAMSLDQVKARLAEGVVELPLKEIVGQVFDEISLPVEGQRFQPECEEISPLFHEIPQKEELPDQKHLGAAEAESERQPDEAVSEKVAAENQIAAQHPPAEKVVSPGKGDISVKPWTILRRLLQKCRGLGISEHVCHSSEGGFAIVLSPLTIDREAAASGMLVIMSQVQEFCEKYRLGPPFGLTISATAGSVACAELVRGESDRLILLATPNKSGAGYMSLLLRKFEAQLPDLSALVEAGTQPLERSDSDRSPVAATMVAVNPDHLPDELCRKVVAALREVGVEKHFSAKTVSGQRLLFVWGEAAPSEESDVAGEPISEKHPLSGGVFDFDALSRYCLDTGLGAFRSLLLITPQAKITLDRFGADQPAYLLCSFSERYADGLVRAKARSAAALLD